MTKHNKGNVSAIVIIIVLLVILGGFYLFRDGNVSEYNPELNQNVPAPQAAGLPIASTGAAGPVTATTAVFTGEVNPSGAQTSYWYEYGTSNSLGMFSSPQLVGGGLVTLSAPSVVSGLSSGTTYFYRLAAENQYGKVYGQILSFKTLAASGTSVSVPAPVFARPTVATRDANAITSSSVALNGTLNPQGSNAFFWFEYGKTFGLGSNTNSTSAGASRTNVPVTSNLVSLEPNTTYYYRLNAQNIYGTSVGNISVFTTQPTVPPATSAPRAPIVVTSAPTLITGNGAMLHGEINPNGTTTTYYFAYGKGTSFGTFDLNQKTSSKTASGSTGALVSETVSDLDSNSAYYYQLVAENQNGTTRGAIYSFTTGN